MNSRVKKKNEKFRYTKGTFSVVKFLEQYLKLFECVPDLWFFNEEKTLCYWPPKSKKSVTLRAMNQDEPEEDWIVYECELVSEGHATYALGSNIARDKASQKYNTSSADEHIQAAAFQRQHPGLVHNGEQSFETLFADTNVGQINNQTKMSGQNLTVISNATSGDAKENHMRLAEKITNIAQVKNQTNRTSRKQISNITGAGKSAVAAENFSPTKSVNSKSVAKSASFSKNLFVDNAKSNRNRSRSRSGHSLPRKNDSLRRSNDLEPQKSFSRPSKDQLRNLQYTNEISSIRSKSNGRSVSESRSRCGSRARSSIRSKCSSRSQFKSRSRSNSRSRSDSRSRTNSCSSSNSRSRSNSRSNSKSRSPSRRSRSRSNYRSRSRSNYRSRSRSNYRSRSRSNYRSRSRTSSPQSSKNLSRSRCRDYDSRSDFSLPRSHSQRNTSRPISYLSQSYKINRKILSTGNRHSVNPNGSGNKNNNVNRNKSTHSEKQAINNKEKRQHQRVSKISHVKQQENRRNSFCAPLVSPRIRSRLRVEEMYRAHEQLKTNQRVENVQTNTTLLQTLVNEVKELKKIVTKNERRYVEVDRRLTRMEVTVNKTFIVLGDVSNGINIRMSLGSRLPADSKPPKGFRQPKLPVLSLRELHYINKDLKNQDFFNYLVYKEKEFCSCSDATNTATMTSYLRRFIAADVRALVVLKELKGQSGETLYRDYHNVYLFLIETMKEGYRIKNKILTNKDVHIVLRTVWGRSKQAAAEEITKKRRK